MPEIQKKIFYDYDRPALAELAQAYKWPKFRLNQLLDWQAKCAFELDHLTNIPKNMREQLDEAMYWPAIKVSKLESSKVEPVNKYLFALADGNLIETVSMHYSYGHSICLTTQVGCRMNCHFCASAKLGLKRNLSAGEMLAQIAAVARIEQSRVSHLVLMGIGEPLDNYGELIKFLKNLKSDDGIKVSMRNITISTCGLVPAVKKLAGEGLPVTLAISLHAPDQATRNLLMPIAHHYPIDEIIDAADYYQRETGRRVSYEYTLFKGINDSPIQARALAKLLAKRKSHINLIPANKVPDSEWTRPEEPVIKNFQKILLDHGLNATVRYSAGQDITAACGQLRRQNSPGK